MRLEREKIFAFHAHLASAWRNAKSTIEARWRFHNANLKRLQLLTVADSLNLPQDKHALLTRAMSSEVVPSHRLYDPDGTDRFVTDTQAMPFTTSQLAGVLKSLPMRIKDFQAQEERSRVARECLRKIVRTELMLDSMLPISNFAIVRALFEDSSLRSPLEAGFKYLNELLQLDVLSSLRRSRSLYLTTPFAEQRRFWEALDPCYFGRTFESALSTAFSSMGFPEVMDDDEVFSLQHLPVITCGECNQSFEPTEDDCSSNYSCGSFCYCHEYADPFRKQLSSFVAHILDSSTHMQDTWPLSAPTNELWKESQINSQLGSC